MSGVQGKVALVTGGASGIGAATATQLVARGGRVVLVDLDGESLSAMVERLGAEARMNLPGTSSGNWRWRFRIRQTLATKNLANVLVKPLRSSSCFDAAMA